jgi:Ser-tRNA(Ala) deacylase AlaX
MHSAEHILNRTMVRMYECGRCFSAHIEKKKSKCDYHFDHALTKIEIRNIERKVNEVIEADMPVTAIVQHKSEAQEQYNLSRLPENGENKVRVVCIGDYDACPCIGAHVQSTAEIGRFRITSVSFNDGVLRIRYKLD